MTTEHQTRNVTVIERLYLLYAGFLIAVWLQIEIVLERDEI